MREAWTQATCNLTGKTMLDNQSNTLSDLQDGLQLAAEIELATVPIYLYTYYSLCRKPGTDPAVADPVSGDYVFPKDKGLYGNQAGAVIMSVAVEEMLHLSLSSNILASTGQLPVLYGRSPSIATAGGVTGMKLPGLERLKQFEPADTPLIIPLAKFSLSQLDYFLRIEYPAKAGASDQPDYGPDGPEWETIGQAYHYITGLIGQLGDSAFQAVVPDMPGQISNDDYAPNNIDTLFADAPFKYEKITPDLSNQPASVASFTSAEDSHVGSGAWMTINSRQTALNAVETICNEGEGSILSNDKASKFADQAHLENTHYYKFWLLAAELEGYAYTGQAPQVDYVNEPGPLILGTSPLNGTISNAAQSGVFVYDFPENPQVIQYVLGQSVSAEDDDAVDEAKRQLDAGIPNDVVGALATVNLANGLYQYMLIMTETIFLIPKEYQERYFSKTMHQSMIWVMDKFYQNIRTAQKVNGMMVVPTFEYRDIFRLPLLDARSLAYKNLVQLADNCLALGVAPGAPNGQPSQANLQKFWPGAPTELIYYAKTVRELPDVSQLWDGDSPKAGAPLPDFVKPPADDNQPQPGSGGVPAHNKHFDKPPYDGAPFFPPTPPTDAAISAAVSSDASWTRHACMGLNSCKNQGRTLNNNCAGQGWCSTALQYNPADPDSPSISDHQCHVQNNCKGQGGCGLYGTQSDLDNPGHNECRSLGSCATPINASRFITDGHNRGKSVWDQARAVFTTKVWPELRQEHPDLPATPPTPASGVFPTDNPFENGPPVGWMEDSGTGMTACGSSGLSGAGSCA